MRLAEMLRSRRVRLLAGGLALLASVGGWVADPTDMARAWLTLALLLIGFPLGALVVLTIDNLTGGRWGEAARPLLLAMAGTLPLALLLFVPLLFDVGAVFPWATDAAKLSLTAQHKLGYLNAPGLTLRFVACAALWLGLAYVLGVWNGGETRLLRNRQVASALGLGVHALVFTVFSTDWMQALEPDFYSTIYPMLVAAEEVVQALAALMLLGTVFTGSRPQPGGTPEATLGEDLGKLLVAAVFFWGYLAFMQWVIIWSGDLPDEIGWYLVRLDGIWQVMLWAVVVLAFAVPFVGLVSRRGKRDPGWRTAIAAATLAGQVLEAIWRIAPAFPATGPLFMLMLPAGLFMATAGLGAMAWLHRRPLASAVERGAHGTAR